MILEENIFIDTTRIGAYKRFVTLCFWGGAMVAGTAVLIAGGVRVADAPGGSNRRAVSPQAIGEPSAWRMPQA